MEEEGRLGLAENTFRTSFDVLIWECLMTPW